MKKFQRLIVHSKDFTRTFAKRRTKARTRRKSTSQHECELQLCFLVLNSLWKCNSSNTKGVDFPSLALSISSSDFLGPDSGSYVGPDKKSQPTRIVVLRLILWNLVRKARRNSPAMNSSGKCSRKLYTRHDIIYICRLSSRQDNFALLCDLNFRVSIEDNNLSWSVCMYVLRFADIYFHHNYGDGTNSCWKYANGIGEPINNLAWPPHWSYSRQLQRPRAQSRWQAIWTILGGKSVYMRNLCFLWSEFQVSFDPVLGQMSTFAVVIQFTS